MVWTQDIDDILNYIAAVSDKRDIFFLWGPYLKDPKDDLVLEVAVESGSQFIITITYETLLVLKNLTCKQLPHSNCLSS